jgi:lauroyl/myristoyl acyltransferase
MDAERLRALVRFDSGAWRRFAELGCVYGPEWWKRASPPAIAGIIFGIARVQRAAVLRNQRRVRGRRGWLAERWDAYRVFAEFARSLTEAMEQWGPHPRPLEIGVPDRALALAALAEGRGLVMPTGHFGSWEVAARAVTELGRPINLVMAREPNPTVREFTHRLRSRHGVRIIYSDRSVFAALPILQALRRHEIVGMQIDPWGSIAGSTAVDFCGRPARFQRGPFVLARVAGAPLLPVFTVRTGIRRYELRIVGRFDPTTPAESHAAFVATVRAYERLVRERPAQWLVFEDVWREEPAQPAEGAGHALASGPGSTARTTL